MRCRSLSLATTALLGTLAGGLLWLTTTESGLHAASRLAASASGGRLQIAASGGQLLGQFDLASLRWRSPDLELHAERIHLDWSPGALLQGRLQVAELSIGKLRLDLAGSDQKTPPPSALGLPLAVDLEKVAIFRLEIGDTFAADELAGRLSHDGEHYHLQDFSARSGDTRLTGQARLAAQAPLQLTATAEITGQLEQHPLALSLSASGPLERLELAASARAGLQGEAQAVLTPFADAPFASAHVALDELDPAAWQKGVPAARLSLRADLQPQGNGIAGHFSLNNAQPGPLDRQRLPLASLSGKLAWQDGIGRFDALQAKLGGNSRLDGEARWQEQVLHLDVQAQQLDAARIATALRSTRLNGPISAKLGADRQDLELDLQDPTFRLQAVANHAAGVLTLPRLELSAGPARLAAHGELALNDEMRFAAAGELNRFDPSRFAKVTPARINASLKSEGKLAPRPVFSASFELKDSQLAGQPLSGRGRLSIDWPRIPQADIELLAGPNRLHASGAFGRPGDRLAVDLEAPQLSPYGLEGGLSGRLDLAGTAQQPQLAARLQAAKLGLPGVVRLNGLQLEADAAGQPDSPLRLDLTVANLATPEQPDLLKQLHLQASGSNQAHQLNASAELSGKNHFKLSAAGGLHSEAGTRSWRGQLLTAELNADDKNRSFRLSAPAPVQLAAQRWRFGPARLNGNPNNWQASLQAEADQQQLLVSLSGRGPRIGQVDGELKAGLHGAWSLDQQAAWLGRLKMDVADLGWLSELLGEQWQSAGRFSGELQVAGTPALPLANGQFRGEKLALRLPEQGLNLANGELDVSLANNLLRVSKLGFDSLLQALPRPLLLAARSDVESLNKRPGRLEITGEMQVDRSTGADNAFLDVRLDRLGIFQLPDQWVAVSGDGRLSWQGGTLGAKGKLAVDAGYWQLATATGAPSLSDDVIIKRPGNEKAASPLRPKLDLDLSTDLGKSFLFKGAGLTARLVGDIRLRASGRDLPRASGSIRTRDGRFDAYGQQLAIERGILNFQGLLDNPGLDVRAVRKGLSVEAGVQISGTAQRPVVKLVSDPELPDAEKLAWLVLGHGPEQMSAGDATVLLSAAGGLLGKDSGGVVQQLKSGFGIDDFGVRQGGIGDTGSRQQSSRVAGSNFDTTATTGTQILSVGKRLSSNAMLSYEQALGKAESIVKLTVNLNRQVSLIGRAGSDNALDLFYTITFGRAAPESH